MSPFSVNAFNAVTYQGQKLSKLQGIRHYDLLFRLFLDIQSFRDMNSASEYHETKTLTLSGCFTTTGPVVQGSSKLAGKRKKLNLLQLDFEGHFSFNGTVL